MVWLVGVSGTRAPHTGEAMKSNRTSGLRIDIADVGADICASSWTRPKKPAPRSPGRQCPEAAPRTACCTLAPPPSLSSSHSPARMKVPRAAGTCAAWRWVMISALAAAVLPFVALFTLRPLTVPPRSDTVHASSRSVVGPYAVPSGGRTLSVYPEPVSFFEDCGYVHQPRAFEDWTPLLKDTLGLHHACVFNPSVVHLPSAPNGSTTPSNLMLLSARFYLSQEDGVACVSGEARGGQWNEHWKGRGGFVLLVVRRSAAGRISVLSHKTHTFGKITVEDVRLFSDGQGKIRALYNRWRGGNWRLRGFKSQQRRSMHTSEVVVDAASFNITLRNEQELVYVKQGQDEKNWVPWEGTSLMTYPQHPSFAPHVVLNWTTYDRPMDQLNLDMQTPVPFIDALREATGGWIRLAGGTPAVLLDKDRFLSVGHAVGDVGCFHKHVATTPPRPSRPASLRKLAASSALGPLGGPARIETSSHACDASFPAPANHSAWIDHFSSADHKHSLPHHHFLYDYFFFLYAWSATAPYEITHISHAFIPYDADDHTGVFFPSGLAALPQQSAPGQASEFLLTYGKDDNRAMVTTLSRALVEEYLRPIGTVRPGGYKFCTVGREAPTVSVQAGCC